MNRMLPTRSEWSSQSVRDRLEAKIAEVVKAGEVVGINPDEIVEEVSLPGRNFVLARGDVYAEVMDRLCIGWVKVA